MKKLVLVMSMLFYAVLFGQPQIYKSSLAPGGGSTTNGSLKMIYTAGENFVAEVQMSGLHLSEGFIGPDLANLMNIEGFLPLEGVSLYPNPVHDYVYLHFEKLGIYVVELYDLSGRPLDMFRVEKAMAKHDLRGLPSGVYVLLIKDTENRKAAVFKIRKD